MKICRECKIPKDLNQFYKSSTNLHGVETICKECKGFGKLNITQRNKKKIINKKSYFNNIETHKIRSSNYSKRNRHKTRKRYRSDINFKLKLLLRNGLVRVLKRIETDYIKIKHFSILKLMDCEVDYLKKYLESKFKPEMNWSNHGEIWEIDHIIPCSSFDLSNLEEQKKCFHYTNLQPLFKTSEIAESFGYEDYIGNRDKYNKI